LNSAGGDGPELKGVFMRYLARFAIQAAAPWGPYVSFTPRAQGFINYNATKILANADSSLKLPEDWSTTGFPGATGTMWTYQTTETSAMDGLVASLLMRSFRLPPIQGAPAIAPPPTQVTPVNGGQSAAQ
jgi:hypothetical protein